MNYNIDSLISEAAALNGSDVHLVKGLAPRVRVDGKIQDLGHTPLTQQDCTALAEALVAGTGHEITEDSKDIDLAKTLGGVRCRINLFKQQGAWSAAIRLLNNHIPEMSELGLPAVVAEFPRYAQGLVLIAGETGSGKSTTLASVLNQINNTKAAHILTLEDPVEYIYTPALSVINQREVGKDTESFAVGLRASLREDPDVILVGEMRDLETIETAITAAETGHLVFGTVHTNSAADSIDRIVGVFPADRQPQIRLQLSMTLKAVLSQQLLPKVGGGRVAACEVMKVDGAIRNLIREGKTPQIVNAIQTTGAMGNILMERALQNLLQAGTISQETYNEAQGVLEPELAKGQGLFSGRISS